MTPAPYGSDPRFVTTERRRELLAERFVPWPLAKVQQGAPMSEMARGYVSNSRFASNSTERVLARKPKKEYRKWLDAQRKEAAAGGGK